MLSAGIINILSSSMESFGTGFFVSPDGKILTCKHVLQKAGYRKCGQFIYYKYIDDDTVHKAKWIKSANDEDLALLSTNEKQESYIPMCDKNISGLKADTFGFPNGSKRKIKATVYVEMISDDEKYIQLGNANTVTFGFSGAPLIHNNIAVGIICSVTQIDSNGRLAETAFAISARRVFEFFPKDIRKKEICIGYGSKEEKCTNFVVSKREGLCGECYAVQFSDAIKSIYQAQNYTIYQCNDFFVAELKYGISTYYDAVFTLVKFGELISLEDIYSIIEHAKESIYNISQIIIVTNTKLNETSLACVERNKIIIKTKEEMLRSLFDFEPYRIDLLKYVKSEQLSAHYIEIYGANPLKENERINVEDYYDEYGTEFDYYDEEFDYNDEELDYNDEEFDCNDEEFDYNDEEFDYYDDCPDMKKDRSYTDTTEKVLMKEYVDSFLESEYKALLILGDYGSGKTSFCYVYTLELLDNFLQGKSGVLPILIKLRGYNKAVGVAQLLTDYFVNDLGINNFNIMSLKLLLKNINVVLIFDGFDEIAKKVDFDIKYDALKEICSLAEKETKIVVTCRPNYFQNASEFEQIFRNSYFPYEPGDKPLPEFIENSILDLELSQIEYYIESYTNELKNYNISISEVLQTIANTHDLTDLAKRPFLLYMILNTLPRILNEEKGEKNFKINAYRLYVVYTDNWIKREDRKNKTLIKKEDKELFCKELAFELYISNNVSLSYKDFPMAIKKHFKYVERIEDIDYFTHDIQSCSFLTSDRSGDFKFIHKSFMEFFVADRVITKLSDSFNKCKKKEDFVKQINFFLGKTYLSMEICLFINDMINYFNNNIINKVSEYFDEINYIAKSNLLSVLAKTGINMSEFLVDHKVLGDILHVDFSTANFEGKILRNVTFDNIQFYLVKFKKVTFINCNFNGTIFEKSVLEDVRFYNCQFCSSEWRETDLLECRFNIEICDYYEENDTYRNYQKSSTLNEEIDYIMEKVIVPCNFADTLWRKSTIENCIFNNCNFEGNIMKSMKIICSTFRYVDFSGTGILGDLEFKDNILDEVISEPYEF